MSELTKIHITPEQVHSAIMSSMRITMSEHEWEWTQKDQEEMATCNLWQATERSKLRATLDKTTRCLMAYNEYFRAIASGEYDSNRRPAPLRDFEQLLLDKGGEASKEYWAEETRTEKKCTCPLLRDSGKTIFGVNWYCPIHGGE